MKNIIFSSVHELTNGKGNKFTVRVEIDAGSALNDQVVHMTNRARRAKSKSAASSGGVVRVTVLTAEDTH